MGTISQELALQLCAEIRQENRRRPFSLSAGQCWGCITFSKGDPAKMCGGVRECNLVVARYRQQQSQGRERQ